MKTRKDLEHDILYLKGRLAEEERDSSAKQLKLIDENFDRLKKEIKESNVQSLDDLRGKQSRNQIEHENRELRIENRTLREILNMNPVSEYRRQFP